ncbi:hypothetical protein ACFX2B_037122 [Malus domestica]
MLNSLPTIPSFFTVSFKVGAKTHVSCLRNCLREAAMATLFTGLVCSRNTRGVAGSMRHGCSLISCLRRTLFLTMQCCLGMCNLGG